MTDPTDRLNSTRRLGMIRSFLDAQDQKRIILLFLVMGLMAVLEVVGIISVLPFLQLVADPTAIDAKPWLSWLYRAGGFTSYNAMLLATGGTIIVFISLANVLAVFSVWQRQRISWSVAHSLSIRLASGYVALPYSFFLKNNSADLIKKNIEDVNGIVNGVFLSGSQLVINLMVSLLIFAMLLVVEPVSALAAGLLFVGLFGLITVFRKNYLTGLGQARLFANETRFRTYVDLVSGIKTIKTDGSKSFFMDRFSDASQAFADLNPKVQFAAAFPRYAIEALAFGAVVAVTMYLVSSNRSLADTLPMLTLFAVAGYRMIPALAGAYSSYAQVISNLPAIDGIYRDLDVQPAPENPSGDPLSFTTSLVLDNVCFRHDPQNSLAVNTVSFTVSPGEKVAFVGPSGSGKTTLIDIVMGLYAPQSGQILIDGTALTPGSSTAWRDMIGYVPQDVYLYEDTIARNIAFGQTTIDMEWLRKVCRWAQLADFIETELNDGYDTIVGENGTRLSGGQRQRIALARAFYRKPKILILDEATSALDGVTEKTVIETIAEKLPDVTILMIAHRISTVRNCGRLYVMDQGEIVAQGPYDTLLTSSTLFQDLAHIS